MKNLTKYLSIAGAVLFALSSCEKEGLQQKSFEQNKKSINTTTEQVSSFLEELDNGSVADRTKEAAFFILEAALNYSYKRPMEYRHLAGSATDSLNLQFTEAGRVIGESLGIEYNRLLTWAENNRDEGQVIDFIDISDASDTNGVIQLSVTVVYATLASASYYQIIGDWKAGANYGDCTNAIFGTGDAAVKTGEIYNFRYANNWINSAIYHNEDVYFTNIKVAGTGGAGISYNFPNVIPDLYLPSSRSFLTSPNIIGQIGLLGHEEDNLHPYTLLGDCIPEADINIYATSLENNIYSVNPSTQGEPFKVFIASNWWLSPNSST